MNTKQRRDSPEPEERDLPKEKTAPEAGPKFRTMAPVLLPGKNQSETRPLGQL